MKNSIVAFIFLLVPAFAFADYAAHQVTFMIKMTDGKEVKGYNHLPPLSQSDECLGYKDYLSLNKETVLQDYSFGFCKNNLYRYYKERLQYNYGNVSAENGSVYQLINPIELDINLVKSVQIIEMFEDSYATAITSEHSLADRNWMNTKALDEYPFAGGFCAGKIYVHEKNPVIYRVIADLEEISAEYDVKTNIVAVVTGYIVSEYNHTTKKEARKIREQTDRKINELFKELTGQKAVVVQVCGC